MPAASQTIVVEPLLNNGVWKFNSDGNYDPPPPAFTPLLADDFSNGVIGENYLPFGSSRNKYVDDHPTIGGKSVKIQLSSRTPPSCDNGNAFYGGRTDLPIDIPIGKSLWVKMLRFFPTTHTWSYCYTGSDKTEAEACDGGGAIYDGNIWLKDMVLSPRILTSRVYVSPYVVRRSNSHPLGLRVISESSQLPDDNMSVNYPLGRWVNTQLMVKVSDTGEGIMRVWIDDELVCEKFASTLSGDTNAMREWGIGDYWNGRPFIDGEGMTDYFWLKDVIIATDVDGYGAPNGIDTSGNAYIPSDARAGDFV